MDMDKSAKNLDLQRAIGKEEEKRLRRSWAMTPEERMEKHFQLQAEMMATLRSNPEAWDAYARRNHSKRRISRVRELEKEMRRTESERDSTTND